MVFMFDTGRRTKSHENLFRSSSTRTFRNNKLLVVCGCTRRRLTTCIFDKTAPSHTRYYVGILYVVFRLGFVFSLN